MKKAETYENMMTIDRSTISREFETVALETLFQRIRDNVRSEHTDHGIEIAVDFHVWEKSNVMSRMLLPNEATGVLKINYRGLRSFVFKSNSLKEPTWTENT